MENAKITNLYNLDETIAKEYLSRSLIHGRHLPE